MSKKAVVLTGLGVILCVLIVSAHMFPIPTLTEIIRKVHGV